jgi:hypothetical protein
VVIGYAVVVADAELDGEAVLLEGVLTNDAMDDTEGTLTRGGTDLLEEIEGEISGGSLTFFAIADTFERTLIDCNTGPPLSAWWSVDDDETPSSD